MIFEVKSKRSYYTALGCIFHKYIIGVLSTCPRSLPDPVLPSTLRSVAFSDANSLGKKYKIALPSVEVMA